MELENLDVQLFPLLGALIVVVLLGLCVGPIMKLLTDPTVKANGWVDFPAAGRAIGLLEGISFTLAIIVGYPVFIGAWLVFKVAAKWETWAHVVRLPDLKDLDLTSSEYETRARFGSWLHSKFVIGALLNILIGAIGAWTYLQLSKL